MAYQALIFCGDDSYLTMTHHAEPQKVAQHFRSQVLKVSRIPGRIQAVLGDGCKMMTSKYLIGMILLHEPVILYDVLYASWNILEIWNMTMFCVKKPVLNLYKGNTNFPTSMWRFPGGAVNKVSGKDRTSRNRIPGSTFPRHQSSYSHMINGCFWFP